MCGARSSLQRLSWYSYVYCQICNPREEYTTGPMQLPCRTIFGRCSPGRSRTIWFSPGTVTTANHQPICLLNPSEFTQTRGKEFKFWNTWMQFFATPSALDSKQLSTRYINIATTWYKNETIVTIRVSPTDWRKRTRSDHFGPRGRNMLLHRGSNMAKIFCVCVGCIRTCRAVT
jgi:hypothetical protein